MPPAVEAARLTPPPVVPVSGRRPGLVGRGSWWRCGDVVAKATKRLGVAGLTVPTTTGGLTAWAGGGLAVYATGGIALCMIWSSRRKQAPPPTAESHDRRQP